VSELFRASGVKDTLRPQALTLTDFEHITNTYQQMLNNRSLGPNEQQTIMQNVI